MADTPASLAALLTQEAQNFSALAARMVALEVVSWSAANKNSNVVLSSGGLIATAPTVRGAGRSDAQILAGDKRYYEITISALPGAYAAASGFCNASESFGPSDWLGSQNAGKGYYNTGEVFLNGGLNQTLAAFAQGDVICWAIHGGNKYWVRVNGGNWCASPTDDPSTDTGGISLGGFGDIFPAYDVGVVAGGQVTLNRGPTFLFTPPAGFTSF